MKRFGFAFIVLLLLSGCVTISEERKIVSSGFVGCKPSDIEIKDNEKYTWTAICGNKRFY